MRLCKVLQRFLVPRRGRFHRLPRMWEGKGTPAMIRQERHLEAPGREEETHLLTQDAWDSKIFVHSSQAVPYFPLGLLGMFKNISFPKPNVVGYLGWARKHRLAGWQREAMRAQEEQGDKDEDGLWTWATQVGLFFLIGCFKPRERITIISLSKQLAGTKTQVLRIWHLPHPCPFWEIPWLCCSGVQIDII